VSSTRLGSTKESLRLRRGTIKLMQKEIVLDLLKTTHEAPISLVSNVYNAADEANRWRVDPATRTEIDAQRAAGAYCDL
jgi:hypothetical protein